MISRNLAALLAVCLMSSATVYAVDLSRLKVYPNPARTHRGDTQITFENVGGGELKIFNAAGRLVLEKTIEPGQTSFIWDLKNNDRSDVASGFYVYYLKSDADERTGKVGIVR